MVNKIGRNLLHVYVKDKLSSILFIEFLAVSYNISLSNTLILLGVSLKSGSSNVSKSWLKSPWPLILDEGKCRHKEVIDDLARSFILQLTMRSMRNI